jgi:MtN3 and saliva related transmembrane protein
MEFNKTLYEIIGLSGAFIVTYSNLPQIFMFFKQKHAEGISKSSNWIGLLGVVLRTLYLIHTAGWNLVILGPYFFAIACIVITLYYCYFPNNKTNTVK